MKCKRCNEPWDLDSLHEAVKEQFYEEHGCDLREALTADTDGKWTDEVQQKYEQEYFRPMVKKFQQEGCQAIDRLARKSYCKTDEDSAERSALIGAVEELMGDDVDGIESALEDAHDLGLL